MRQWIVPNQSWWTLDRIERFAHLTGMQTIERPVTGEAFGCATFETDAIVFLAALKSPQTVLAAVSEGHQKQTDWATRFKDTNGTSIVGTMWDRMVRPFPIDQEG